MARKRNNKKLICSLLCLFLLVLTVISGWDILPAFADTSSYTDVLEDLQKDSSFKVSDYPENAKDYSIYVIQVAEGENKEIFIYTYQPCQNTTYLVATDVNMAVQNSVDFAKLYSLTLINSNGVFAKYIVNDKKRVSAAVRTYDITSIYRAWDNKIDGATGTNNTGEKKAFAVNNIYCATTQNGEIIYYCEPTYVVRIIDPYADFLLYTTSNSLPTIPSITHSFQQLGFIDAHYIVFSTDLKIDKLKSATVTYTSRSAVAEIGEFLFFPPSAETTYGTETVNYAYPTYVDKVEMSGSWWTTGTKYNYSWDRIQTVEDFIATESKLTDETKQNLEGKQWVLRFAETQRTQKERTILGYKKYEVTWTEVKKVSVLRLEFETDGKTYNIGAVCDAVSDDGHAGNVVPIEKKESKSILDKIVDFFKKVVNFFDNLFSKLKGLNWWHWLLIGIGVLMLIGLVVAIFIFGIKLVFKAICWLISRFLQGIWWLISLPFRGLKALFKRGDD